MRPALVLGALALGRSRARTRSQRVRASSNAAPPTSTRTRPSLWNAPSRRLAPANGPCLPPCPLVGGKPFDRCDVRPPQPPRCQVVLAVAQHAQECFIRLENGVVQVRDHHADDVGVDQAAELAFPFLQLAVETAVLQRCRRLRGEQPQHCDPGRREHTCGQVVLEVQQGNYLALLDEWQAEYRADTRVADVLIVIKRALALGGVEDRDFVSARDVIDDRSG